MKSQEDNLQDSLPITENVNATYNIPQEMVERTNNIHKY